MLVFILNGKLMFETVEFMLLETLSLSKAPCQKVDQGEPKHQRENLIFVTLALWRSFLLSLFSSKVS